MINVGNNYGKKVKCPICKLIKEDDTQEHLFKCVILKLKCPDLFNIQEETYNDIFSLNNDKLIKIARICETLIRKREELLY